MLLGKGLSSTTTIGSAIDGGSCTEPRRLLATSRTTRVLDVLRCGAFGLIAAHSGDCPGSSVYSESHTRWGTWHLG